MHANPFESQLERLARTLTERFGVTVICQGDSAYTDGRRIVLPSLPEPMDESLERMVVGYLDHEMSHVAFSDFKVVAEFAASHPGHKDLLNVVEDALIERRAMERWPGVRANLDSMFRQVRGRVAEILKKADPFRRFCTAIYLKLSHHNDMMGLESELAGYEDLLNEFPSVNDTHGSAELAAKLSERWLKRNSSQANPKPQEEDSGDHPACAKNRPETNATIRPTPNRRPLPIRKPMAPTRRPTIPATKINLISEHRRRAGIKVTKNRHRNLKRMGAMNRMTAMRQMIIKPVKLVRTRNLTISRPVEQIKPTAVMIPTHPRRKIPPPRLPRPAKVVA